MRNCLAAATAIVVFFCAANLNAEFVNGVETFPGTTEDTTTWTASFGSFISQNNGLIYNAGLNGGGAQSYNTNTQTIAYGQSVKMMAMDTQTNVDLSLFLTNNSAGSSAVGSSNSAYWSFDLDVNSDPQFDRIIMGVGDSVAWGDGTIGIFSLKPLENHVYGLQIQPLSSTTAIFTVFDSDGTTVLESHMYTVSQARQPAEPASIPDNTHISIEGGEGSAFIESVSIPEPTAGAIVFVVMLTVCGRSRKPRCC